MDRRCSPNRSLSWRLVSPMYWHPAFTFVALHHRFWATYRKVLDKNRLDDLLITYSALQSKPWNGDSFQPVSLSLYVLSLKKQWNPRGLNINSISIFLLKSCDSDMRII